MANRVSSAPGALQGFVVQKEKRVIWDLKELLVLLAPQDPWALQASKELSEKKELPDERGRLEHKDLTEKEAPLERMVHKAHRDSKGRPGTKVIREIEGPWDLQASLDPKDQRVTSEKRAREGRGDQKARGESKAKLVPGVHPASRGYRVDLADLVPKDLAVIKVSREDQVHRVLQALPANPERLAAYLGNPQEENDDLFPMKWTTSL